MYVNMHARLTGGAANVHPNIVPIRRMITGDETLRLVQQRENGGLFCGSQVKEIRDVTL
jgi:hypothetical protein